MFLSCSLASLALGEASRHVVRTPRPSVERPMWEKLRPPTNRQHQLASHVREPSRKQSLQPQSSLQMDVWPMSQLQPHERPVRSAQLSRIPSPDSQTLR